MLKALVYGWYGSGIKNIGDLLFCESFKKLFPNVEFTFTNYLTENNIKNTNIVIIGGGSFLYADINHNCNDLIRSLSDKPMFYIGVGMETGISEAHRQLMANAKLIAIRNENGKNKLPQTQAVVLEIPDIVYCLAEQNYIEQKPAPNSILVLPNAELLPRWNDIGWCIKSWEYFKSEFAQTLDHLKENKSEIKFAPMCLNDNMHDLGAAAEIINCMKYRNFQDQLFWDVSLTQQFNQIINTISKFELIISQRYHGAILAHMANRPCVVIAHHDKLKNPTNSCITLSYYELSKQRLLDAIKSKEDLNVMPIKLNRFEELRQTFYSLLGQKWQNSLA